jgi:all-trans-retinol dehydrogenase (NAD+)
MIRCFSLIAASVVLHTSGSAIISHGSSLPLPATVIESVFWFSKWSFTLWAIYEFNAVLNRWAENRWVWNNDTSDWNWKNEIAVVTGGSQGIGACVVERLVSHGVSCAVLDVAPLSAKFTEGRQHHEADTWHKKLISW